MEISNYLTIDFLSYVIQLTSYFMFVVVMIINISYLFLLGLSIQSLKRYVKDKIDYVELPVSIIVPFFNQENTIVDSIKSFLKQNYENKEIILINDGSVDRGFQEIIKYFDFVEIDCTDLKKMNANVIDLFYCETLKIYVINKKNGGKSDAINCGLFLSKFDYFCVVDGDSILKLDALKKTMIYFARDPKTVAVGSTIRDANGLDIFDGEIVKYRVPKLWIERFQHLEYLKSFLLIRSGLDFLKSNLIISGAFGCFRKDLVMKVGGFTLDHLGEDMDLIIKIHKNKAPDEVIRFNPESLCLTQVPYDKESLKKQRVRWQRGLLQSLFSDDETLIFKTTKNIFSYLTVPYFILAEIFQPLLFIVYYILLFLALFFNLVMIKLLLFFGIISMLYNIFLSILVIYYNEKSFPSKMKDNHFLLLIWVSFLESFGYRQMISLYKVKGILKYSLNLKDTWGTINRKKF